MDAPPRLGESRDDHDDDSGVSDTTSSTNSSGEGHAHHVSMELGSHDAVENGISTSERWAHVMIIDRYIIYN